MHILQVSAATVMLFLTRVKSFSVIHVSALQLAIAYITFSVLSAAIASKMAIPLQFISHVPRKTDDPQHVHHSNRLAH